MPFIDVLIVIVIFLAVTTTYSQYAELKINLPVADANNVDQPIDKLDIAISQSGEYFINGREVSMESPVLFAETLRQIAGPDSDPVIIISAANFAGAILIESGLSFLGIGAQPPMPSWGGIIKDHYSYIVLGKPYLAIIPGLAIMSLVTAFMLVGNALRDALDVKN